MKYFSMFSGVGGFEYGIERAYSPTHEQVGTCGAAQNSVCAESECESQLSSCGGESGEEYGIEQAYNSAWDKSKRSKQGEKREHTQGNEFYVKSRNSAICIGYSEIDKYASAIYKYHYPEHKNYGDATRIIPGDLPDFDLLIGGFPCQAFSVAGKRGGFDDSRGTLFFEVARILRDKRPECVLLENVKGLLSHDDGKSFLTIIGILSDIGYTVEWQVLNSKDFGVPQNRERVYIVGHLGAGSSGKVFPLGESGCRADEGSAVTANCFTAGGHSGGHHSGMTLIEECKAVLTPDRIEKRQNGRRTKNDGEPMFTLTGQDIHGVEINNSRIRRLTPIECERLQAFPDNWTKYGDFDGEIKEISDTQRYKCVGNSVTTTVIEAIISEMKKVIK